VKPPSPRLRVIVLAAAATLVAGCSTASPTPPSTPTLSFTPAPTASPTASPTPTPAPQTTPLAVVTGFTNLLPATTLADLQAALADGTLLLPCGIESLSIGSVTDASACTPADAMTRAIHARPKGIGLLPPGLVSLDVQVLPVDGADLFGSTPARSQAYPVTATVHDWPAKWTAYDPASIITLISTGDSCPDRGVAYAALTLGKGWAWVLGGGTARYSRIYPNPVPLDQVGGGFNKVDAVRTGNLGAVRTILRSADLTVSGYECPVIDSFTIGTGTNFSTDPRVLAELKRDGVDVVTLGANHATDKGLPAMLETIRHFNAAGIAHTGTGANLDAALTPAVVTAGGVRFGFVAFNIVTGAIAATPTSAGVAWMTQANVTTAVERAKAESDVVICMPEWWPEYHADFSPLQQEWEAKLLAAGCDHILGRGTHWVGGLDLRRNANGDPVFVIAAQGNFLFGQDWSQQTMEGVLPELTFRGTELVQARFHPYVILDQAQPNLTDPQGDGHYVLDRMFEGSLSLSLP
jgi:poly-gamma-glutamate capsule biosynthesis protein CapA/YwtB (metallophosphatase superfamily)